MVPTCNVRIELVESIIAAKAKELNGQEYCQFRHYQTLFDIDKDGTDDFIVLFTVEGIGGGGNNHYDFMSVFLSSRGWQPITTRTGGRGERDPIGVDFRDEKIILDTLDIGGGFPVSYVETVMPIDRFCEPIAEALEKYFDQCRVIAEPGRFLVASAVWLITQVVGKSRRGGIPWYYIDDGLYGSFSGRLFDKCDYTIQSERDGDRELCVIAGPTCDSFDVLYTDRALAPVEIGDLLIVPGMGAYTNASASTFNGFPVARLVSF